MIEQTDPAGGGAPRGAVRQLAAGLEVIVFQPGDSGSAEEADGFARSKDITRL